jgi:hypothetical protein
VKRIVVRLAPSAMKAPASTASANVVAVSRLAFATPTVSTRVAISAGAYASMLNGGSIIVDSQFSSR